MTNKKLLLEKLNKYCNENNIILNDYQLAMLNILFDNPIISNNYDKFTFIYSADNEIAILRIGNNSERSIFIGQEENDIFFIGYAGRPAKRYFLYYGEKNVNLIDIINMFIMFLE